MLKAFCRGINTKSAVITTIAVFVYVFATDYLIHGVILKETYSATASLWRPESEMQQYFLWLLLGQFIIAKFFTLIFAKGYEGTGIMEGVRFGLLIGFFSIGPILIQYAVMPLTCPVACWWAILGVIQAIGAGIVAAMIYKKPAF